MATSGEAIRHLWTHKTQDHPWLADEELVIERAEGVYVWTERGKKLIDGFAGLAVVNVGHGRREIAEAIAEQTVRLAYYPTTRQFSNRPAAELAAKIASLTPGDLDYSFFAVSGAEANERAMQMARHYWLASGKPGKYKVISLQGGYHGGTTGTFAVCGLPNLTEAYTDLQVPGFAKVTPPYPFRDRGTGTDEDLVKRRARELREAIVKEGPESVSAVIMEPVLLDAPASGFLAGVKAAAHRHGALLIFDEIVSGFRWAVGGAQEHFGVVPDLATFGKGMANGLPLAAVVGPRELMREFEDVFVSSTFGGDTLALAACLATLGVYGREPVIEHLWRMGRRFQDGFGALAARLGVPVQTVGYPVHPKVVIDHRSPEAQRLLMSLFLQETAARGVIFHFAGFNVSYSHTEADVDQTLDACADALRVIGEALADGRIAERLRGKPYQEAFRRS